VTIFAIYGTAVPRLKMRKSDTSSRARSFAGRFVARSFEEAIIFLENIVRRGDRFFLENIVRRGDRLF
jgi:hypothetical protein